MTLAEVSLWNTKIGTVMLPDDSNVAIFRYDRDFLNSGIEISPITMPLSTRQYSFAALPFGTFHGLPGLLADSLPDRFGNAVIDQWLARQGRDAASFNAIERLCYTGKRGMGALEFVPVLGPDYTASEKINVDSLVELASEILGKRKEMHIGAGDHAMEHIFKVGTSAGGARAKAIVAWNEKTNDIRSGQVNAGQGYRYWIIKFDGVSGNGDYGQEDLPAYTRIEYAYSLMAKAAGIDMSECRLYRENDRYHFMTKRFDREADGRKLHMQTLGAIAHYDYNDPTGYSYEMAAAILRKLGLDHRDMEQLCLRMIFNVMTKNNDDHVKNISFLMDRDGEWSLAPAYDLTFSYDPNNIWLRAHQMSVNGKRSDITKTDLLECAATMNITKAKCGAMIARVEEAISLLPTIADEAHLPKHDKESLIRHLKPIK